MKCVCLQWHNRLLPATWSQMPRDDFGNSNQANHMMLYVYEVRLDKPMKEFCYRCFKVNSTVYVTSVWQLEAPIVEFQSEDNSFFFVYFYACVYIYMFLFFFTYLFYHMTYTALAMRLPVISKVILCLRSRIHG